MAITLYTEGNYRVYLNDNSTIEVYVGSDEDGFIAAVGSLCITTSNVRLCFAKKKLQK